MTEPACYAEVTNLLRNIDRPYRLRDHRLLAGRPFANPRQLVEEALESLPARWRTIVARCDLAKERHAAVALHLGISERHFYRERRKALAALAEALDALPRGTPPSHAGDADPDAACLACASALANMGRSHEAIALLDRALLDVASLETRGAIAIRAAELSCATGEFSRAAEYLAVAERTPESSLVRLEAQSLRAELLLRAGHADRAKQGIERAIHALNAVLPERPSQKARALVAAHLVLVEISDELEAFGAGLEAAIEAANTARRHKLEPAVRFRAQSALTQMRLLTATPIAMLLDRVAADYELAQTNGLPRDCADTAALFCVLCSYAGQHDRALAFGRKALEIDRTMGTSDRVHRCYLAWAFLRRGNAAAARATVDDLLAGSPDTDSFDLVIPRLIQAEALHVERRHHDALAIARNAVYAMRRIGSHRGLGSALRVQAEIQNALGEKRSAVRSIDQALSLLGKNGPPYALAQAYGCSARLTGNRRHKRVAREMMELFRA